MKQSILFVIDSLNCAGAEKSLISLLSLLDYEKYEVDLQLIGYGGQLEKLLPKEVNLLPPFDYMNLSQLSLSKAFTMSMKTGKMRELLARVTYSYKIRKAKSSNAQKARIWWQTVGPVIEKNPKVYDYAISYAQGVPTFYVIDKVEAAKKFTWVNVSYRLQEEDRLFQREYYRKYNRITAVSQSAKDVLLETFPELKGKIEVIYDINASSFIYKMAEIGKGFQDDFDGVRILTVGRLAHQKGYEIALESCKKLKEMGINFRWYALGIGPLKEEIEDYIKKNELVEHFKLLGVKSNPYPYIKNCDIYVQTSRFEGFGLAIAEARILNKPIVTTKFDAVFNQMKDGKNGLVVEMNAQAVTDGIKELLEKPELKQSIIHYLEQEKKGNEEEIEKFYALLE